MNKLTGAVVIGRNEGERLLACLQSLLAQVDILVYVDSGSTDNSLEIAEKLQIMVVNLDMSIPFTAARARNAGFRRLYEVEPRLKYVQFIDGDCELVDGWVKLAASFLDNNINVAIDCGRLKERNVDASIYNALCDIEWDTSVGIVKECGGIFMIRADVFNQIGGFKERLIAGEEPELCVRVRQAGSLVCRLQNDMAWHDANMAHFSQWWKRAVRSGYAYAEGAWIHGKTPQRHWVREVRRNWLWGLSILVLLIMAMIWKAMALLLIIYPVQILRIYRHSYMHRSNKDRFFYAFFCVLANLPIMLGQIKFHMNRFMGNKSQLIEYK